MAAQCNGNKKTSCSASLNLIKQPSIGLVSSSCDTGHQQRRRQQQRELKLKLKLNKKSKLRDEEGGENNSASGLKCDFVTSAAKYQQPLLAASFSFNSYQDIICDSQANISCNRQKGSTGSTFGASDIKAFNKEQHWSFHRHKLMQTIAAAPAYNSSKHNDDIITLPEGLRRARKGESCLASELQVDSKRQLICQTPPPASLTDNINTVKRVSTKTTSQKNNIVQAKEDGENFPHDRSISNSNGESNYQMRHLRQRSVGGGKQLILVTPNHSVETKICKSVASLISNNTQPPSYCVTRPKQQQQHCPDHSQKEEERQQKDNNNKQETKAEEEGGEGAKIPRIGFSSSKTMSQTLQSIHSLSMQLNRAASQSELAQSNHHLNHFSSNLNHLQQPNQNPSHHLHHHHHAQQQQQQSSSAFNHPSYQANSNSIEDLQAITSCLPAQTSASLSSSSTASSSNRLTRLVGKKAARVKEILLQNLGKADKTTDELFELYEENFYKQQAQALKLQKEFKSYLGALKLSQEADKSLNNCIQQSTGDYQSARHDLVCENLTQMEHLNEDLMEKLRGLVMLSINEYLTDFNELREKISKRKRKLIDYDSSKRIYEMTLATVNKKRLQMQQKQQQMNGANSLSSASSVPSIARSFRSAFNFSGTAGGTQEAGATNMTSDCDGLSINNKSILQNATSHLVEEARLLKLREQFNYCKIMYETINSELYEELPMVYEKKMKHLLMTLQNYFSLEAQYHLNAGKLFATASDVIDELPMSIHQHHHHHHQQQQQQQQQLPTTEIINNNEIADNNIAAGSNGKLAQTTSGSSGMGSSRAGDSSMESSSSPDASSCNDLQINSEVVLVGVGHNEQELAQKNEDDDKGEFNSTPEPGKEEFQNNNQELEASSYLNCPIVVSPPSPSPSPPPPTTTIEPNPHDDADEDVVRGQYDTAAAADAVEDGNHNDNMDQINKVSDDETGVLKGVEIDNTTSCNKLLSEEEDDDDEAEAAEKEETKEDNKKPLVVNPLYKVKTSYKYLAEDVDELCFEADEIIQVIEFDETQELEEGWLMGIREVNGQRGLFPANFTQPI